MSCHIWGFAPVNGEGRVRGAPFYFRARHGAWSFTVCVSHDIDPSCIDPPTDTPGFFVDREYRGYYLSEWYGKEPEASWMKYDEAERIIRDCVQKYLKAAAEVA
jgi:hypothetical protein